MLRVPINRSKVKYFKEKILQVLHVQYLGFVFCGILLVLAVFQDSVCEYCHTCRILGVRCSGILLYLKYLGVRYSGILSVLELFRDPVLLML